MESISRFWISLFFILFNLIQQAQSSYSHADGVDPSRSRQISVKPRFSLIPWLLPFILLSMCYDPVQHISGSISFTVLYANHLDLRLIDPNLELFRAFVYEGFLTDEECDHLISLVTISLIIISQFHSKCYNLV